MYVDDPAMARCADCYTLMFADEMHRCPAGHWTCPGCVCDCPVTAEAHMPSPQYLQAAMEVQSEKH